MKLVPKLPFQFLKTFKELYTQMILMNLKYLMEYTLPQLIITLEKQTDFDDKNFILEAFKEKDINSLNNKQKISNYNYDKLIKV